MVTPCLIVLLSFNQKYVKQQDKCCQLSDRKDEISGDSHSPLTWIHLVDWRHGKSWSSFSDETNLQDALSMDIHYIHYNVMQRSKNRNKTWYLRQDQDTHKLEYLIHTDTQMDDECMMWQLGEFFSNQVELRWDKKKKKGLLFLPDDNVPAPYTIAPWTVWAEEAATWSTPTVNFTRKTSGRKKATTHVGWAWSLKQDHNTGRCSLSKYSYSWISPHSSDNYVLSST